MRYAYGTPREVFEDLVRDRKKKSPFVVAFATVERCEEFRRIARERFGRDEIEPGLFRQQRSDGNETEWRITFMGRPRFGEGASCAIEDGASNHGDPGRANLPECIALLHVFWDPRATLPPPPMGYGTAKIRRVARACTFYGAVVFLLLFLVAALWETWH